jgi:hypothetical protein
VPVVLRGGNYNIKKTVKLENINANGENTSLVITAYNREKAVLNGGVSITLSDMSPADESFTNRIIDRSAATHILQYDLKQAGIYNYGEISRRGFLISANQKPQAEISLDGEVQRLAAWPNNDYVGLTKFVEKGTRTAEGVKNGCSFEVGFDRPALWNEQNKAWVSGVLGPNYTYDYYPVERFDAASRTVYLREGALQEYYSKQFFKFENIPEELDYPGEYYIDRESGMLYYYPAVNALNSSVLNITMLEDSLISLNGSSNIRLENITIEGGRGSAVTGSNTNNIRIKNCTVRGFGENGIKLDNASHATIDGCRVHDVGKYGIQVSGGNYASLSSSGNLIYNNDIYNFARLERSYHSGIGIGYRSIGVTVKRNHIHNGPHAGIIYYGANHLIEGNEIDNVVLDFHDMDAIYANLSDYPWERGTKVIRNYFHDLGRQTFNGERQMNITAVRTDNTGSGLVVKENLFYNIGFSTSNSVGGVCAQGSRNKVINNIFVNCSGTYLGNSKYVAGKTYSDSDRINTVTIAEMKSGMNSRISVYGKAFPELYNFFDEHPQSVKTNEFKDNFIINIGSPLSTINGDLRAQGFRGAEELVEATGNYISTADPGFVNYSGGNFGMTKEARSKIPGFPNIQMSDFGNLK